MDASYPHTKNKQLEANGCEHLVAIIKSTIARRELDHPYLRQRQRVFEIWNTKTLLGIRQCGPVNQKMLCMNFHL